MKILVTMPVGLIRDSFFPQIVIEKLINLGEVIWNTSNEQFSEEELRQKLEDVDICITGWECPRLNSYILENANKLKLVAHTGGSVASLVSDFLYEKGIRVISGNEIYAESVAEGVLGYMIASLRDIPLYDSQMKRGLWRPADFFNEGLAEQTIGLVGFGAITKHLVRFLAPFRLRIKVHSNHLDEAALNQFKIEKASLEDIFTTCKIVSLHVSQRPDTYHMVDKRLLEMLPRGAILINTARGSVIDEAAMVEELKKNRFKALLDVFEVEPLPKDSELRKLQNVILMPHMAGPTIDRRKFVTLNLIEDIKRMLANETLIHEISKQRAAFMTT